MRWPWQRDEPEVEIYISGSSSAPEPSVVVQECDHDWRVDPGGWKEDSDPYQPFSWPTPPHDVVMRQSRFMVCAKCDKTHKEWRINPELQNWPKEDYREFTQKTGDSRSSALPPTRKQLLEVMDGMEQTSPLTRPTTES